ncbi:MAG: pyruvate kinase, partial [Bacteroidota bacterium]
MKKKTKIVATVSDLRCDVNFIRQLYKAGMNVARLNTAHQSVEATREIVSNIRKVSEKIAIMIDTKGPEIRTTRVEEDIIIKKGAIIEMKGDPNSTSTKETIFVNYIGFVDEVPIGSKILIDDGHIEFSIKKKENNKIICLALNDGVIKSKKSVNVPNASFNLPALNNKDREYLQFAIDEDIDFIAHSFVRNKNDLKEIQDILDEKRSRVKIIAKIENKEGVYHIDEILEMAYGIMVARGDLGVEVDFERLP